MRYKKFPLIKVVNYIISLPFIYGMIIPFILFDICLGIYHQVCFRLYGIELIKRSQYIKIDRHKLKYLNPIERVNCAYCGYANGLMQYSSQVVAKSEEFWCSIKHAKDPNFKPPAHHDKFLDYGDEDAYKNF